MQTRAIGFDFDHTLGIDNKLETHAFVEIAQRMAAHDGQAFDPQQADGAITDALAAYRSGRCSLDDAVVAAFASLHRQGRGRHGPSHPLPDESAVDEFRATALAMAPRFVQALPGVEHLLRALDASGVPYAILTNGWNPLQAVKAVCIGFTRSVFVSDDLGVRKPDVHAFAVLCDHFGLPADHISYVGDDPATDIVGALSAGMKALWFDWEGKRYPTNIPGPTAVLAHIGEVMRYVGEHDAR